MQREHLAVLVYQSSRNKNLGASLRLLDLERIKQLMDVTLIDRKSPQAAR